MKVGEVQSVGSTAVNNANKAKEEENKSLENIAAMRALNGMDGASMMIADSLLSQISGLTQGIKNANDAIGMLQIADSTLNNMTLTADRINVLSVQLGNGALNETQKAMIQSETNALRTSMKDSVMQASFNGKNVFASEMTFVTGNDSSVTLNVNAPNTSSVDVNNQSSILRFLDNVNMERANIGAIMNGIEHGVNSNLVAIVNLTASESNQQDNDVAENYNEANQAKLKQNAALYANSFNTQYLQQKVNTLLG
ncbi:flagellin [Helicobacter monodelphidis]|uniref:flagellin n=1 Tax=Helicobacter sp. 15-1451 TaxID=2004995 RepID=UPI000DCE27B7|nr:flagellin [Helicobacter sp. 15-1451]RAX58155.1 flagellin [Helicobacter sp. 15-1451]